MVGKITWVVGGVLLADLPYLALRISAVTMAYPVHKKIMRPQRPLFSAPINLEIALPRAWGSVVVEKQGCRRGWGRDGR